MKIADTTIPASVRLRKQLEQLPHDEVFETNEIADKLGIPRSTMGHQIRKMSDCVAQLGTKNYWGSPKAIAALKKHHKLEIK